MRYDTLAPNSVDVHIGQRIQLRRNIMGLTQEQLAVQCRVSFQQIQKYEKAANRISASRLFQVGLALDTPVAFFFSGLPKNAEIGMVPPKAASDKYKDSRVCEPKKDDPFTRNETLEIVKLYWQLPSNALRQNVISLLRSMNGQSETSTD